MAVIVLIFLTTNVSSAILIHHQRQNYHSLPLYILVIRVSINGTLFLLAAIVLSVCIYKMRTMSSSNVILEAKVYIYTQHFDFYNQLASILLPKAEVILLAFVCFVGNNIMSVTDCLQFNHSIVCLSCHIQHSSCSFNQQDSKFWIWMVKCYFTGIDY